MAKKVVKKTLEPEKVTWEKILEKFKTTYPRLGKSVFKWSPEDYATIRVTLKDGMELIFNYDENHARLVYDGWNDERRKR